MQLLPSTDTWSSNSTIIQPLLQEIIHEAELANDISLPSLSYTLFRQFEWSGDREQYQQVYFARRSRLAACAIAAMVTEDPRHVEQLQDTIWEICNEYTWCLPAHLSDNDPLPPQQMIDLFAAETAHTLSEIITLLGERMESTIV